VLPLESITMNRGTGILAAVPSADPEDFMAFRDL
jgi:hypothetical protein